MAEGNSDQLITQEAFVSALTEGIKIPAETGIDMHNFGHRLIRWINSTDNIYWAAWDPENLNRVILDLRNCELMQLHINPGLLEFRRVEKDVEHDLAIEFGNGAIGVMLFCMLENGEIEEFNLDDITCDKKEVSKNVVKNQESPDESDFEWV